MDYAKEMAEALALIGRKEALLGQLVVWLKAKGLYEEAMRDCPSGIKLDPSKEGE